MVSINCKQCNKNILIYPARLNTAKFCSKSCLAKSKKGYKFSKETIKKFRRLKIWNYIEDIIKEYASGISLKIIAKKYNCNRCSISRLLIKNNILLRKGGKKKGIAPWNKGKRHLQIIGNKNPNWKGGITPLNQQIRHCIEYKEWVRKIFNRDNFICKECKKRGGDLEADHYPLKFSQIMKDNNIKSYSDAQKCSKLWNLDNGRTLCLNCHNKTKSSLKYSNKM